MFTPLFIPLTAYDRHFILTLLALVLALIEILIVPGFGIAGLASMALALADVVVIYLELGPWWAMAAVGIGILVILITMRWLTRSKAIDRMSLHARIDSTNATTAQLSVKVGDTGKALTRLALVGNAEINGLVVEVKSSGAFLNPGTPCASSMSAKPTSLSKPFSNENAKKQPITNLS